VRTPFREALLLERQRLVAGANRETAQMKLKHIAARIRAGAEAKAGMLDEIQTKNILLGIAPLLPTNNRPFGSACGASRK
jgi:hypothetical protein